jgi:Ca2+-binding RTX toxin-like protein
MPTTGSSSAESSVFTITGTNAAETIDAGDGPDILLGGGGDDVIHGYGSADLLTGGSGNDILAGGAGDDAYVLNATSDSGDSIVENAGEGTDVVDEDFASYTLGANLENLFGTSAAGQSLTGNGLANFIWGFTGNDVLNGLDGNDILKGDSGNDTLDGGAGADSMAGDSGNDVYFVDDSGDTVTEAASAGTDEVRTSLAAYALGSNVENLTGLSNAGQALTGNSLSNLITGGSGNDVFRLEAGGNDIANGNDGDDSFVFGLGFNSSDRANGGAGNDSVFLQGAYVGTFNAAAFTSIETLVLMSAADTRFGSTGATSYSYSLTAVDSNVAAGVILTVDGSGLGAAEKLTFSASAETDGRYVILGGAAADSLTGGAGADLINGGAGADSMSGLGGNDVYVVDSLSDVVTEAAGAGTDEVRTALSSYTLGANLENLTGTASTFQDLRGNSLDNALTAGSGGSNLRLQDGGHDVATGGTGSDTIYFGASFDSLDRVAGGSGSDSLLLQGNYSGLTLGSNVTGIETLELMSHGDSRFGGANAGANSYAIVSAGFAMSGPFLLVDGTKLLSDETLSFDGSAETSVAFVLDGGAGNDVLKGGALGDTLDGGAGADTMAGGLGNDYYWVRDAGDVVQEAADAGTDSVRTLLASYTLAANVENLIGDLASTRNQSLTGNALDNNITAGAGDDVLDGGGGTSDHLDGGAGNDRLLVHQVGTVSASGGTGSDTLVVDYSASTSAIDSSVQIFTDGQGGMIHDGEGRWTSFSSIETFEITAGSGDDHIVTGSGSDYVDGGAGSDVLEGGAGNDGLYDLAGATTIMRGGDGDDYLYFRRWYDAPWQGATIEAGDGNDRVAFGTFLAGGGATIDLGAGDDILYLDEKVGSELFVTTGAGRDTLQISGLMDGQSADVVVTDFQAGAGGDVIDWATAFPFAFGGHGYQSGTNPFAQGYAKLEQAGNDTLLQISPNADGNFDTVLTFRNTSASAFTADNLGWAPFASQAVGANPNGTSGNDWLTGSSAGTFFHLEQGGDDLVTAGSGNDAFYFGSALTSADRIDGGGGADQLALQGDYSGGLTLGAGQLANIETLVVLPHDDFRFGGGGASPYSYDLTLTDDSVAAGQQLKVNASTLKAGENFTFDGHAETNGSFFLYGGKGVDNFTGGSGADVFFFVEDGRYAPTDHVDGGGGADAMVLRGDYNLTLSADSLVNVETVVFLSGTDARFYASGTDFHYSIATADNTVGAGVTMTFNGGALRGTETLSFDGSAESDGHMRIFGGAANDHIIGGGQSDLIFGGDGADVLTGGGGNDEFRFQNVSESSVSAPDKITDFTAGDFINLGRIDAVAGGGDDAFRLVGAFDGHAGELVLAQGADNVWTVSGDVDGNGQADFQIQVTVTDGHLLGVSDFVL